MSILTVAKIAGVSHATVSRVINRRKGVSDETARAVQEAMQTIGFIPSERRPGPKPNSRRIKRKARIVCLCNRAPSQVARSAGFELFLRGAENALAQQDLGLHLMFTTDVAQPPPGIREATPDGLLLHGALPTGEAEALYRTLPAVWLMANRAQPTWGDQVMPNSEAIGQLAAQYLLERGHRHLALVNTLHGWFYGVRAAAFQAAAAAGGATATLVVSEADADAGMGNVPSDATAQALLQRFLSLSPRPTGLFVADEPQALWFHSLLQRNGVVPGRDVEMIACNNEADYLSSLDPRPATMDIRLELIGRLAVERLLWRMENPSVPGRIVTQIDPMLIPGSTPPRR